MAEPETRADTMDRLLPWLWHWSIGDERIGGFRSDSYALHTADGVVIIDALPLSDAAMAELHNVCAIVMTHRNHQRSTWSMRRSFGVPVYAPSGSQSLDDEADVLIDESTALPGGLRALTAAGFRDASYLVYEHDDGTAVLFCGDLICHDPAQPYRFPNQPSYFDPVGGREDAKRLLELPLSVLCAAHAEPSLDGCKAALRGAVERSTPSR